MQTILASRKFRKSGVHAMETAAQTRILDVGDGVRLKVSYSPQDKSKALVILLHGWEGSQESTYVVSCARQLHEKGCAIARVNFRDHGDTHDLNEAPFHSARLGEVYEAVRQCAELAAGTPIYLVGFSLGGNFALRIVRDAFKAKNIDLAHVFAISPVIDPENASPMVDENPLVKKYFYNKWSTSLRKKQAAFPDLYDFEELLAIDTVMEITERFLPQYTEFDDPVSYFRSYKVGPEDLSGSDVPVTMIMAKDDPVIPAGDMFTVKLGANMRAIMLDYGGHNGFFQTLRGPTWYDSYIHSVIFGRS